MSHSGISGCVCVTGYVPGSTSEAYGLRTGSDGELELSWKEGYMEGGNRGLGCVSAGTFDLDPR